MQWTLSDYSSSKELCLSFLTISISRREALLSFQEQFDHFSDVSVEFLCYLGASLFNRKRLLEKLWFVSWTLLYIHDTVPLPFGLL